MSRTQALVIFLLLALLLAACDDGPRQRCVRSHPVTETVIVPIPWPMMGGVPIGSGMSLVTQTVEVCDVWERLP